MGCCYGSCYGSFYYWISLAGNLDQSLSNYSFCKNTELEMVLYENGTSSYTIFPFINLSLLYTQNSLQGVFFADSPGY